MKSLTEVIKGLQFSIHKHAPEILTGIGIAGMLTTTVLAVKATPKAMKLIEDKKQELETDKLTPAEVVKTTWKCYIPAASTAVVSTACLVGSSTISGRRNAALATAYKVVETARNQYREKVLETIGEKKEELVRDKIAKDQIEANPVCESEIYQTRGGTTLCFDSLSARYFYSSQDVIERAVNKVNRQMINHEYASLNDLYEYIGLEGSVLGEQLGWSFKGCKDGTVAVWFSSQIAQINEKGIPCLVVNYNIAPIYDYDKLY